MHLATPEIKTSQLTMQLDKIYILTETLHAVKTFHHNNLHKAVTQGLLH